MVAASWVASWAGRGLRQCLASGRISIIPGSRGQGLFPSNNGHVKLAAAAYSWSGVGKQNKAKELVGREGHTTAVLPSFGLGGRVGSSNSAFGFKSLVALSAAAAAVEAVQSTVVETEEEAKEYILNELPAEPVTLYQYAVCPFCNKLRAYLDYMDISYTIVEVNPLTKSEIKGMKKNKNGKLKVPIVGLPGRQDQMVESDDIIDEFQRLFEKSDSSKSWFGSGSKKSAKDLGEMKQWRDWVNNRLVHVLTVNIYRSVEESFETFDYITDQGNFNFFTREAARYSGAGIMYFVSKGIKKKRDLPGDERTHLYEAARNWTEALDGRDYHGGKKPNLADLSVFGVIRAIEGFATFNDLMESSSEMKSWYYRVKEAVGSSALVVS